MPAHPVPGFWLTPCMGPMSYLRRVAPSVAHQVTLDLRPGAEAAFAMEPPAYLLHHWLPGAGLITHQAYVDPWPGPYPFAT